MDYFLKGQPFLFPIIAQNLLQSRNIAASEIKLTGPKLGADSSRVTLLNPHYVHQKVALIASGFFTPTNFMPYLTSLSLKELELYIGPIRYTQAKLSHSLVDLA